jgi:hypothetical protein
MKFRRTALVILVLASVVLVGLNADAQNRRVPRGRTAPGAGDGIAYAALQAVGATGGWGRIVVRDDQNPDGVLRKVTVWLHGLEPRTEYLVVVDEVEIGTITTRPGGSGSLELKDVGAGQGLVPADLPLTDEIVSATVYGPSLETTLEGTFSSVHGHHAGTKYEEEIALEDVTGGDALGMAKVEMKDDDHQEFKTRASGLDPGQIYTIIVDGLTVGLVTADDQGQAHLHLEYPDDENPIPEELRPVSDIVTVEWYLGDQAPENLVLSGSFEGAGFCEKLVGTVLSVSDGSFTLETPPDTVITVTTTENTTWEGFDPPPTVDDRVKVEGCWEGEVFVAYEVKLLGDDDENGETGGLCTQSMGGWGQSCNGNNVGCLRDGYFDEVFPNGLCLGENWDTFTDEATCTDGDEEGYSIYLSSSEAVAAFAVQGGRPGVLTEDLTDPMTSPAGVFAGQLLAALLNVGFDAAGIGLCTLTDSCDSEYDPGTLGMLIFGDCADELEGLSVWDVIALANFAISGADLPEDWPDDVGIEDLKDALEKLNRAFVDCRPGEGDCLMLPD